MEDPADWPTGRLLSTAARLVEHAWTEHLESVGVTHAGLIALHVLASGPVSQRILADRCQVQAQTMSRILERLERDGLITRCPDPKDGRRVRVRAAPAGRDVLAQARSSRPEVVRLLDDAEAPTFRDKLIEIVRRLGDERWSTTP